ncbi:MAG: selenocysteine-specific translation elongation factor [Solirubrobacteraceae bacterium]
MKQALTLGTAGHIDHGKTALVRALTGVDTDRLPEEKERGVSIALGYASLELPSGRRLSVVDVPGHERFVRTMVAGATGIDLFLLALAADDGVMPQTREHARVLAALGVRHGVVAVTKSDMADPARAGAEARELFPQAEIVPVSARTGDGLDDLRAALDRAVAALPDPSQRTGESTRLHVDRVFTIRGAGTVVTGTLWAGTVARGDELELQPAGRRVRVRGVQVHDEPVESAAAGQRAALNLTGVARDEVERGDALVSPGAFVSASWRLDATLDFRPGHGDRVQVHHGTREAPARLAALGGRYWQVRLETPLLSAAGDRFVVRRIAPPDTLGGGVVLDPAPARHGPGRDLLDRLTRLERGEPDPAPAVEKTKPAPVPDAAPALSPEATALEERLRAAGHEPPLDQELPGEELAALRAAGRVVRTGPVMHFHVEALREAEQRVVALAEAEGSVTLARVRDELGTSRKFAQAILEHCDSTRLTIRRGEVRVLRARRQPER